MVNVVLHLTSAVQKLLLKCILLLPQCSEDSQDSLCALDSGTSKSLFELIKIIVFPKTALQRKSEVTKVASFFFISILL